MTMKCLPGAQLRRWALPGAGAGTGKELGCAGSSMGCMVPTAGTPQHDQQARDSPAHHPNTAQSQRPCRTRAVLVPFPLLQSFS